MRPHQETNWIAVLALLAGVGPLQAAGMQAYFADFTNPAVLADVNPANAAVTIPPAYSSCASAPPNVVFGVNFTSGLAYRNGTLYGLEWQNGGGPPIFLYSFSAGPCATGTRVGTTAVGPINLEGLAYCAVDGFFYSVDFDFPAHLGQLVRIHPSTGVGTLVGAHMALDVRIVGMVCDAGGQLWAVSSGFGGATGRNPELLQVNRNTGVETLIGLLNLPANQVESLAIEPAGTGQMFAAGKALYRVNSTTGAATLIGGTFNEIWAMAGLPSAVNINIFSNGFEAP